MATTKTKREPRAAARKAGLRYADDRRPGITRQRAGTGFRFRSPRGVVVKDQRTLARIRALAIPPAWTDVWISPDPRGHLQATGRDARGRKQYRYHPDWRSTRDGTKFHRMIAFGKALPRIRRRVAADLARAGLPREKALAAVVRILDRTSERVGNSEYARANGSFGLTTIRDRHAKVRAGRVRLRFRGKGGKAREVELHDPRLARVVRRCQELPGQELFAYVDEGGEVRDVTSTDVNDYLREIGGDGFTSKDFRTWSATCLALAALRDGVAFGRASEGKRRVIAAIRSVAEEIGNTPAVCRRSYIHPAIVDAFMEDRLAGLVVQRRRKGLGREEVSLLRVLAWHDKRGDDLSDVLVRSVRRAKNQ